MTCYYCEAGSEQKGLGQFRVSGFRVMGFDKHHQFLNVKACDLSSLQALQWVLKNPRSHDPEPNDAELLFTNFGRAARHRSTQLAIDTQNIAVF